MDRHEWTPPTSGSKWARYLTFELVSESAPWVGRGTAAERDERRSPRRDLRELHGASIASAPSWTGRAVGGIGPWVGESLRQPSVQLEPGLVVDDVLLEVDAARRLLGDGAPRAVMRGPCW